MELKVRLQETVFILHSEKWELHVGLPASEIFSAVGCMNIGGLMCAQRHKHCRMIYQKTFRSRLLTGRPENLPINELFALPLYRRICFAIDREEAPKTDRG
jgi:hypothetical protein